MPRVNSSAPCTVDGCDRPLIAKGMCKMHYYRVRRSGSADLAPQPSAAERFWEKVDKDGPVHPDCGRCWIWTAATIRGGYGVITVSGKSLKAHRFSWEIRHGAIPDDMLVCHHCDHPSCVNPDHLFLGTDADNMEDMKAKGRQARGERQHMAKLDADQVLAIRQRYQKDSPTDGSTALAKEFGVSHPTILRAVKRYCWKHVS